ncbi:hypothetical protein AAVH_36847, partial [Aphelenchoides avenae]
RSHRGPGRSASVSSHPRQSRMDVDVAQSPFKAGSSRARRRPARMGMPDRAVAAYLRSSALRFEWSCDHQREGKAALRIPTCIADLFSSQPVQNREDVGALPEEQNGFFNQSPPVCLPEPSEPLPIPNPLRGRSRTPVQPCVAPIEPTVQRRSNEANGSMSAALPNGRPAQKTAHPMDPSASRFKVLVKGLFPGHSMQQIRACFGETKIVGVGIGFAERGTTGEALVEFAIEEDALRAWGCRVRNIGLRQIDVKKYTGLGTCQSTIFIE